MFSWEICKNFKNTFIYRTPPVAASAGFPKAIKYNPQKQPFIVVLKSYSEKLHNIHRKIPVTVNKYSPQKSTP